MQPRSFKAPRTLAGISGILSAVNLRSCTNASEYSLNCCALPIESCRALSAAAAARSAAFARANCSLMLLAALAESASICSSPPCVHAIQISAMISIGRIPKRRVLCEVSNAFDGLQVSVQVSVGVGQGGTIAKVAQDISRSVIVKCGHLVLP